MERTEETTIKTSLGGCRIQVWSPDRKLLTLYRDPECQQPHAYGLATADNGDLPPIYLEIMTDS